MRLALIVEYEGTNYRGFQCQSNAPSIQEELEKAIASLTNENIRVKGAGRTDAGVHAEGQVVAFDTLSNHSTDTFVRALNYYLPKDIAIRTACQVSGNFDPRRDALSRAYRYTILNGPIRSPMLRKTTCLVRHPLNVETMQKAAKFLEGTHDFARFSGPLDDRNASTVRHIFEASVCKMDDLVIFDVRGSAFLPHQVRRMAGSLVDVGRDRISLDEFSMIIDGGCGKAIAHSLPPQGLCLIEVTYC